MSYVTPPLLPSSEDLCKAVTISPVARQLTNVTAITLLLSSLSSAINCAPWRGHKACNLRLERDWGGHMPCLCQANAIIIFPLTSGDSLQR